MNYLEAEDDGHRPGTDGSMSDEEQERRQRQEGLR